MKTRVLVLGAGFGGLELGTMLSDALADEVDVTLIDREDSFVFGYSKLDVMFGRATPESVRLPYREYVKPGVRLPQETITAIDPESRRVTTDVGTHEADVLVVALGADYDTGATPGLAESGDEFYSFAGALRMRDVIQDFSHGSIVVGVCGAPFKCPPAPSECVLLLHDQLVTRGIRGDCEITLVLPFGRPVPPSPETSESLVAAFAERDIRLVSSRKVRALDLERHVVVLDDDAELPYDHFLGVPKHRAPDVVVRSGMTEDGYVPVDPATLETRFAGVYAIGDVATPGDAEGGGVRGGRRASPRDVADRSAPQCGPRGHPLRHRILLHRVRSRPHRPRRHRLPLGAVADGVYQAPSIALRADKQHFGASRRARWFGRTS